MSSSIVMLFLTYTCQFCWCNYNCSFSIIIVVKNELKIITNMRIFSKCIECSIAIYLNIFAWMINWFRVYGCHILFLCVWNLVNYLIKLCSKIFQTSFLNNVKFDVEVLTLDKLYILEQFDHQLIVILWFYRFFFDSM
jgi:hypothetical protein